jgi:hypothetical protein
MAEGDVPQQEIDAPFQQRSSIDAWLTTLPLAALDDGEARSAATAPAAGHPFRTAPGSRAARTAAQAPSVDAGARGNWVPTGPRNITGRIRALAVDPGNAQVMYAGAASGGIFKSTDGGETWAPSWTDAASQSIGGISICHDHPEVVWVATGEVRTGGAESLLGSGVHRSPDSGATWANQAGVPGTVPNRGTTFDAIAAHPADPATCWAVGPAGVFRTRDSGQTWSQYDAGVYYSDVAFSTDSGGNPVVFLVRARSSLGEASVVRVDAPDDASNANVQAAISAPTSVSQPIAPAIAPPAPARPLATWPARGKIAICRSSPAVAFVRFVLVGNGDPQSEAHIGIFRTQNAQAPTPGAGASAITWTQLPDDPGFADDHQGGYTLAIGVNADNAEELATGMLDVYVSTNANHAAAGVTFKRVLAEDLTLIDAAQHGDVHVTQFALPAGAAPGTPPTLWIACDGGISSSGDWRTSTSFARGQTILPLPTGTTTWRKHYGISASQMYSLTQSPLLPSVFGCGFQDNGVLFTDGGQTWRVVIGADGGFLAFDPDDPYTVLATWQGAIDEAQFPGKLEGGFALPGYPAREGIWPRQVTRGFLATDGPRFVADTAHHPRHGDRVLHARLNRLYGSTESSGDRWRPETAGRGFDLQLVAAPTAANPNAFVSIEVQAGTVQAGTGAAKLGLPAQLRVFSKAGTAVALVRSMLPGPYALADGDTLTFVLTTTVSGGGGAPVTTTTNPTVTFTRPADRHGVPWTAEEIASEIVKQAAPLVAMPCFRPRPWLVELTTTELGPNAQITLGGTALNPPAPPNDLAPLGLRARTYHGSANRPASVTLIAPNVGIARASTMKAVTGQPPLQLTIQIGAAGPVRTITFDTNTFADLDWIHAGELEEAIRAALQSDPATVTTVACIKRLLISDTSGAGIQLGGTAAPRLNMFGWTAAAPAATLWECNVAQTNTFDLTPTAAAPGTSLSLTFNGGTPLAFNQAANDLRAITSEELQALISAHLTTNAIQARCDLEILFDNGFPSKIAYSQTQPDTAWVGSTDGTLCRTTSDGGQWDTIQDPALRRFDRRVEAIAIDPVDPQTVYVGLEGQPTSSTDRDEAPLTKAGLLFKTTDGGATWKHVGGDVKDTAGSLLGAYALQIDPAAHATVFVATEVGVFRSTDAAASWQPFNEGLPPGLVRDLDFVPERRVLRAGVWGRGTFERQVGDTTPKDVRLFVRSSLLDDGTGRPAPRGPDVYASTPTLAGAAESPDVKVARDLPPVLGASNVIDGSEFDDDIAHEPLVSGPAGVFVQVHNGGSFPATAPRIACLWADASAGPPALPPEFWSGFHAGALAATVGDWTLVHDTRADATVVRDVRPGYPVVKQLEVTWPGDIADHRRVGIVVLVESTEDPLTATQLDVGDLLASEPKVAYRETGTVRDHDDGAILVRQTTPAQFTIAAPPAALGLVSAAPTLFPGPLMPGGPVGKAVSTSSLFFSLPATPGPPHDQGLTFATVAQSVTVTFGAPVANPAQATLLEVANLIRTALLEADAPVTLSGVAVGGGAGLRLTGVSGTQIQVTGGTAAPNLGFAIGPLGAQITGTVAAPYNLSAGAPQTLVLAFTKQTTVRFSAQPGFDPTVATARELRRLLNQDFTQAHLPLEAVVPRIDLWIRRSITDIDGLPSPVAGRGLADLVASPAAVPLANQAALFDLITTHGPNPVKPSTDNFLYLRVFNLGNNDLSNADSRHSLYALDLTANPITSTQIAPAGGVNQTVPAESSTIIEFHWNPRAASPGDRLFVLAVADDRTNSPLAVPATFSTVAALDAFCSANPNASYRMFVVSP